MSFNFFKKNESDHNFDDIKEEVLRELLRQVRYSYNLALGVTAISALITLSGVGLLYLDKVPEASLTAGGGVIASLGSVQFAKEAKEELRQLMTKLSK